MNNRFGISLFPWGSPTPNIKGFIELARKAEEFGFDLHITSHLLLPPSLGQKFGNNFVLEPNLVIAAISNSTESVKIGVTCIVPLLHPCMWAKILSTLDIITNGRLIPELAVGWYEPEFQALGVNIRKRGAMMNEQIEIIKKLWTEEEVTYQGNFYKIDKVGMEPKPVQKPHPPIWIACGESPTFMPSVKRSAKYGDFWFPIWPSLEEVKEYYPKLTEESRKHGKKTEMAIFSYVAIEKDEKKVQDTVIPNLVKEPWFNSKEQVERLCIVGTPEQCAEKTLNYLKAGVSYFVLDLQYHGGTPTNYAIDQMEIFANDVIPLI